MAVHAHPDDEASKGAATSAYYVARGAEVRVVTCTGGERGDILNSAMSHPEILANIADVRRTEMAQAAQILGVSHAWLGFEDSGLPEGDPLPPLPAGCFADLSIEDTVPALVAQVREFRPHVITTYDENGGYPHPDHIRCHEITVAAWELAADPEYRPDLGAPWAALKLYYDMAFHLSKVEALHAAALDNGIESPFAGWVDAIRQRPDNSARLTTRVPCAEYFGKRDEALRAHATQIDPDGHWFTLPLDLQSKAWPTEDFYLAQARIPTGVPETDLFAGVDDWLSTALEDHA